jgi:hypothetical protein
LKIINTKIKSNYKTRFKNRESFYQNLNYLRISGKFIGITGNVISISNAIKNVEENPNTKTVTSLITKTAIIGLGFIPVYGWAIAIVAGVADGLYGDTFYDYVDDLVNE